MLIGPAETTAHMNLQLSETFCSNAVEGPRSQRRRCSCTLDAFHTSVQPKCARLPRLTLPWSFQPRSSLARCTRWNPWPSPGRWRTGNATCCAQPWCALQRWPSYCQTCLSPALKMAEYSVTNHSFITLHEAIHLESKMPADDPKQKRLQPSCPTTPSQDFKH